MAEPGQRGSGGPPAELEEESRSSSSALARLCALCSVHLLMGLQPQSPPYRWGN